MRLASHPDLHTYRGILIVLDLVLWQPLRHRLFVGAHSYDKRKNAA